MADKKSIKISYEINLDPEVWELTDVFGERALRVWLQILSTAHSSKNKWIMSEAWLNSVGRIVRQYPTTVSKIVGWMIGKRWLESMVYDVQETPKKLSRNVLESFLNISPAVLSVCNFLKYNEMCDLSHVSNVSPLISSLKIEEKKDIGILNKGKADTKKKSRRVSALIEWPSDARFDKFWALYPKKRNQPEAQKAWHRDIKPDDELADRIMVKLSEAAASEAWMETLLETNGKYIPNPATWLRAKGWLDEYTPMKKVKRLVL